MAENVIKTPVSDRLLRDEDDAVPWANKECIPLLREVRRFLNMSDQRTRNLATALGLVDIADWVDIFDDFLASPGSVSTPSDWQNGGGTGSANVLVDGASGGIFRRHSNVTPGATFRSISTGTLMGNYATTAWWLGVRMKQESALTANATSSVGVRETFGNATVSVGVFGANSASQWAVQYDGVDGGSYLNLGADDDRDFHQLEMWCAGDGKISGRLDGGVVQTGTQAAAPAHPGLQRFALIANGADAVDYVQQIDWVHLVCGRQS